MEMGRYMVRNTKRTNSNEVKNLLKSLQSDGVDDFLHKDRSFTAVLQPKDLEKVYVMKNISVNIVT